MIASAVCGVALVGMGQCASNVPARVATDAWLESDVIAADGGDAGCPHASATASCKDGWCLVPSGCFALGSPPSEWGRGKNTEDVIQVTLTHSFIIQQFELTQGQWSALGKQNRSGKFDGGEVFGDCIAPDCPASMMSIYDAFEFANTLSSKEGLPLCYALTGCEVKDAGFLGCQSVTPTGLSPYECGGYRLPTDAEWEYAIRGGTTTAFYSGGITSYSQQSLCMNDDNLLKIAWYCANSGSFTHPVGQKQPNALGIFDMAGNAYELVSDPFNGRYDRSRVDPWAPFLSTANTEVRGGAAHLWASLARSADRNYGPGPAYLGAFALGFRLARTIVGNWSAPTSLPVPGPARDSGAD